MQAVTPGMHVSTLWPHTTDLPLHGVARGLQQSDTPPTVVATVRTLLTAIEAGTPHIEVQAHLDLTSVLQRLHLAEDRIFGELPATVKSIRVRCCTVLKTAELMGNPRQPQRHQ